MTANVTKDYDGDMVLEVWDDKRKMTVYVDKRSVITSCLTVDEGGAVKDAGIFDALVFLHKSSEMK